ncbi:ATP-binding protein [Marinimicrobium sp. C6131]|uniref:ATP-binding protein n=1 Tax=Marinimicrobium sp. C6131 TaxID=3022676 RepID=UPI00223D037A|nr:ATP-binding protein [Marinimicrobium sp. C6131]UZJ44238.1 ATP-binding protein [Marinimicrobium sp. C6131]
MARDFTHPPSAACLVASMRDLGYTLETAIADLIDNSISAGADSIDIICATTEAHPLVAILDNGVGMTEGELKNAMRHGAINPKQVRSPQDLGRFGLGLKTASFSQCRSLTVVSKRNGVLCGAEWNLDRIDAVDEWVLSLLDETDIHALPYVERISGSGTAVIWRELDRLVEDEVGSRRDEILSEKLDVLDRHLALVFHRFLAGEIKGQPKIAITVNGHSVIAFDPFCRKNPATQILPEEVVYIGDIAVRLQPYVLPHHSRLATSEYDFYQNRSDFISNQGAYIYRNGRLMAWGDWFRLIPKGEATKLARVQIDFPNSLDESWTIDIKKSRARPPLPVRERLRQIISKVSGRSTTVHRGRGQRLFQDVASPVWERYVDHGGIRYSINGSHPLIQRLAERIDQDGEKSLNILLAAISASLPVEMIYSDYSTHPKEVSQVPAGPDVIERLCALRAALWGDATGDGDAFREIVRSTRLFERHQEIVDQYIDQEFS